MSAGTPPGPEGFRQFYARLRSAFPDLRYTVDDLIAEGDKVVVRWTWSCTHTSVFRGIAPTGKQATVTGMAIYCLAGGKIVERWVDWGCTGCCNSSVRLPDREQTDPQIHVSA